MRSPLLVTRGLTKCFGGVLASDGLDFDVAEGELHAIIGPNGAGKSTLIRQLIGEVFPDSGTILFNGSNITRLASYRRALLGISRSYQITSIFPEFTAMENVAISAQAHKGHSFKFWQPASADTELNEAARLALNEVGLIDKMNTLATALAHGERRQLELAMSIVSRPRLLLLDEPMAGMSGRESEAMVRLLVKLKPSLSIVLVEHDMDAVFALADRISVLVYGRKIASGSPHEIRASADVKRAYLGDRHATN